MDGFLERTGLARYVGNFVYGATDGIVTTFAVVASVAGAQLQPAIVIILGIANLIADGMSMASSNYLASKSEADYLEQGEETHREHMKSPLRGSVVTFVGFVVVGIIPLLAYILRIAPFFQSAIILAGLALFGVGAGRTIVTKKHWLRSGVEMLLVGGAAGAVAYIIGALLKSAVGVAL